MVISAVDPWHSVCLPFVVEGLTSLLYTLLTNFSGLVSGNGSTGSIPLTYALIDAAVQFALICVFSSKLHYCHFNPAITLATMFSGQTKVLVGTAMLFAQAFGSFIGSICTRLMLSQQAFVESFATLGLLPRQRFTPFRFDSASTSTPGFDPTLSSTPPHFQPGTWILNSLHEDEENVGVVSSRLQLFTAEVFLSMLIPLAYLLQHGKKRQDLLTFAFGVASLRTVTSVIAFEVLGGQAINLARLLANNIACSIFLLDDRVWRLFYLSFFANLLASVMAAGVWWMLDAIYTSEEGGGLQGQEAIPNSTEKGPSSLTRPRI